MTIIIELCGSPGTGKSTNAARLFSMLKDQGISCELVTEYVKTWAYEHKVPKDFDQFYLFAKQLKKETSLYGKVDYIITDSPLQLQTYYAHKYLPELSDIFDDMLKGVDALRSKNNVKTFSVFLNRVKKYDPNGRFQTEEETNQIANEMKILLDRIKPFQLETTGDINGCTDIYNTIIKDKESLENVLASGLEALLNKQKENK